MELHTTEPPTRKSHVDVNETVASGLDAEGRINSVIDRYNAALCYAEKPYRGKSDPDSKTRFAILGEHIAYEAAGPIVILSIDAFEPGYTVDPKSKTQKETRFHRVGVSVEGEKIFSSFAVDAWKFFEEYEPDGWATKSEWQGILDEMAPAMQSDKAISLGGAGLRRQQTEAKIRSDAAKENPNAALAQGIAAGVAAALAELGLAKPKKG